MTRAGRQIDALRARLGGPDGLARVEQMLEISVGERAAEPAPLQWGTTLPG